MYIYIFLIVTSFFISSCTFKTEKLFKAEKTIIGTNKLDILNLKSNVNSGKMINNEVKNFSIENIDAFHAIYNIHIFY